jgi:hypothetical protein
MRYSDFNNLVFSNAENISKMNAEEIDVFVTNQSGFASALNRKKILYILSENENTDPFWAVFHHPKIRMEKYSLLIQFFEKNKRKLIKEIMTNDKTKDIIINSENDTLLNLYNKELFNLNIKGF